MDTCNYKECKLFDLLGGTPEQCPNYQEMWFTPSDGGKPILVKDCAPRRTFLMISELHQRLIGVEKASEEDRNSTSRLAQSVTLLAQALDNNENVRLTINDRILLDGTK